MIDLNKINKIYLYPGTTDFRKRIPGLLNVIGNKTNPHTLYIFSNAKLTSIKIIEIEENAIWLYEKRLLKNRFNYPKEGETSLITKEEIISLINGVNLVNRIEAKNPKNTDIF